MPVVSSSKETNIILIKVVDYSDYKCKCTMSSAAKKKKKKSVTATETQKNNFPQITNSDKF